MERKKIRLLSPATISAHQVVPPLSGERSLPTSNTFRYLSLARVNELLTSNSQSCRPVQPNSLPCSTAIPMKLLALVTSPAVSRLAPAPPAAMYLSARVPLEADFQAL